MKKKTDLDQVSQDPGARFLDLYSQIIDAAIELDNTIRDKEGPPQRLEINPIVAAGELRKLIQPFDWAWKVVQIAETPSEMERTYRNMFLDAWIVFIGKSNRAAWAAKEYDPDKPRTTALYIFTDYYLSCLDVVNWQLFFDRVKGIKRQYSMTEVTEILGLTRQTIATYIDKGLIQAAKYGRSWRFPAEGIEQYLSQAERKKKKVK
jgi:excisionase family DNA binding protein